VAKENKAIAVVKLVRVCRRSKHGKLPARSEKITGFYFGQLPVLRKANTGYEFNNI
jgi:hypothetical protein